MTRLQRSEFVPAGRAGIFGAPARISAGGVAGVDLGESVRVEAGASEKNAADAISFIETPACRRSFVRRFAAALVLAALSCNAAAEWVVVDDNDEYIAYADPDTISREGDRVQMSDLVDLKSPRPSPYGNQHASATAKSEFDCQNSQFRRIAFSLHSGQMGNGELVETVGESNGWLSVAPGTLLSVLQQFACN